MTNPEEESNILNIILGYAYTVRSRDFETKRQKSTLMLILDLLILRIVFPTFTMHVPI